ncbi:DNA repair protein RAD50 [Lineolata rhizophorae]|uniref:DNA repair protein RAD50 n=1 Tax=Lineolata rhizophorae TaxID=578093 RepID=A0A6A6PAF3_9PEZI|nr:DNA repair protein RAD50 [Lineolata rhizophorae]
MNEKEVNDGEKDKGHATSNGEAQKEGTGETDENNRKYHSGLRLWILTFGLAMTTFVVALDNTIIATAIPKITAVFDSLGDVGWYGSAYLVTSTSLQPSFGKVYSYFNVKRTYLSALTVFEVGSILCAAATSSEMLIIGRAIAGCAAAALFSGGMTIIGYSVPLHRRAIYMAALYSMYGIASVVGPILGGAFTDRISWRWCFWINLPFGGVAMATVFFFFQNPKRHANITARQKFEQVDIIGAFFLISAIVCLLLALQWGGSTYPWSNPKVWGCLLAFGLIIIVFFLSQWRFQERATIPPRILLHQRTVLSSALVSLFLAMGTYTHSYYLPFYFQAVQNTSASESGIRCLAYVLSVTCASLLVGALITWLGHFTPFAYLGTALFTAGSGLLYTLGSASPPRAWIGYQIAAGLGAGATVQVPFIAVQAALPERDMPTGNAVAIFFNTLGGAVAISVAQNVFVNTLAAEVGGRVPGLDPSRVVGVGATELRDAAPPQALEGVLEAYAKAVRMAFVLPVVTGGLAALCSLLMEWKSTKGKGSVQASGT